MDAEIEEEESIQDRYSRMSRIQKLALLMIALGPQASATLLKRFDTKDSEIICKEIGNFPIVDQELQDCVLDEFSEIIESSVSSNLGGMAFAQKTLELAHGDYRANNMMNRIAPVRDSLDFMDDVTRWSPVKFTMFFVSNNPRPLLLFWLTLIQIKVRRCCS